MDTNWSRIWLDFKLTIWFLGITIGLGLAFVLIQGVGLRAPAFLWALATLAFGGLVGFLFGIPRVLQDSGQTAVVHSEDESGHQSTSFPVYRMQVNTNLEQISDWLTKIIVGVGLIELRSLPEYLNGLSLFIASGLGNQPQSQVLAIAVVLYFAVLGFLGGYLMTRIYLAQAFSRADWGAQNTLIVAGTDLTIAEASKQSRNLLADLQDKILTLQKLTLTAASEKTLDEGLINEAAPHVRSILWVDDNPKNNTFVIERLTKLGISVTQVLSTSEALLQLKAKTFDRIISDMGRIERGLGIETPVDLLQYAGCSEIRRGGTRTRSEESDIVSNVVASSSRDRTLRFAQ